MRRTKEESRQTRENILDAAAIKFVQKGVSATTLSEIAKRAGVTRGAIYWHFDNKMDLFDALHERIYKILSKSLAREKEQSHSDPLRRLEEICLYWLTQVEKTPQFRESLMLFWVSCDYEGEWASFREKHLARKPQGRELFAYYVEQACEKGLLPSNVEPEVFTSAIVCYLKGIVVEYLKDPQIINIGKQAPVMLKIFFKGLSEISCGNI